MQLPGEIRNIIYSHTLYPCLKSIFIAYGNKKSNFAQTVLNPGLFRVSQQVRAEALSFLCASKHLQFCGIHAANAFLGYVGTSASDVKRITVSQTLSHQKPLSMKQVDKLIRFLDQAAALRVFELEVGSMIHPFELKEEVIGQDWMFLEKVGAFVKGREGLEFQWSAGSCDSTAPMYGTFVERSMEVRRLFGEEKETPRQKSGMYLW
jgi:hypothetical protein